MKNIQVIDGADNCAYDIFAASDRDFRLIFGRGKDIAFIGEVDKRLSREQWEQIIPRLWKRPVPKPEVQGIHGTLFYQLDFKKKFYPNRREDDLTAAGGR